MHKKLNLYIKKFSSFSLLILFASWQLKLPSDTFSDRKIKIMAENQKSLKIDDLPDLLTVKEVAEILRVSPLTIKRWGKRGKLPAIRINSRGDRRYRKEAVLWLLGMEAK